MNAVNEGRVLDSVQWNSRFLNDGEDVFEGVPCLFDQIRIATDQSFGKVANKLTVTAFAASMSADLA